jgi:hypothetical protein
MKRFIKTKFFLAVRDASSPGINAQVMEKEYDRFVKFLFSECVMVISSAFKDISVLALSIRSSLLLLRLSVFSAIKLMSSVSEFTDICCYKKQL